MKEILTVRELNDRIQFVLESSFDSLWVEGEVSNLRKPGSGHLYFTLKDESSQIRAVIFRPLSRAMAFEIQDGMLIICRARLSLYKPRGEYQLIIDVAEPKGIGALQIAFEQLKARLQAEGLFDPASKKPIPYLPSRIGVITSPSGAVIRDILNITKRRFPSVGILLAPVRVQGAEAPAEIVEALHHLNETPGIDVIILARGGGSLEDLMAFNSEGVARAIHASRIPVISAVGHEVDFTIADFVADLRAPTPSAAAELAVPVRDELLEALGRLERRLVKGHDRQIRLLGERVETLRDRLRDPLRTIAQWRMSLDERVEDLAGGLRRALADARVRLASEGRQLLSLSPLARVRNLVFMIENMKKNMVTGQVHHRDGLRKRLEGAAALLESLSPLSVLGRGYSIVRRFPDGRIVRDSAEVSRGDEVGVRVAKGSFDARVVRVLTE